MQSGYTAPAASQAWCNTSGCASTKPCQRRHHSIARLQPRLCRQPAAPGTAAVPGPPPQPPPGAVLGPAAHVGCATRAENSQGFVMLPTAAGTAGWVRCPVCSCRESVNVARTLVAWHRGAASSKATLGSPTCFVGAFCPLGASVPGSGWLSALAPPTLGHRLVSLPGWARINLKGVFQLEPN